MLVFESRILVGRFAKLPRVSLVVSAVLFLGLGASACPQPEPIDLSDDPTRFIENVEYRRGILERDLVDKTNDYASDRLAFYGLAGLGWEALPERDPLSRAFTTADIERLALGEPLERGNLTALLPDEIPDSADAWQALGRRVFFEHPLRASGELEAIADNREELEQVGFLFEPSASGEAGLEEVVSLRVFEDSDGRLRIGQSCAQCHASRNDAGVVSPVRSNRAMNLGSIQLLADGFDPDDLPAELDSTAFADLARLGPGRGDVLFDGVFNPFAFPDLGGLIDLPYLHHTANWFHRGNATLAVRCQTLFITASRRTGRLPEALAWAIAAYYRSLPAPPPPAGIDPDPMLRARGEDVFVEATCVQCHVPPLYTSDRMVSVEEVATDASAGESRSRFTGLYRIPSLRGVGGNAPYLHHGAFNSLPEMFDPGRSEPGHPFGLDLDEEDRAALLAFLNSI